MVFIALADKNSNIQIIKMHSVWFSVKEGFYFLRLYKLFYFPKENQKFNIEIQLIATFELVANKTL